MHGMEVVDVSAVEAASVDSVSDADLDSDSSEDVVAKEEVVVVRGELVSPSDEDEELAYESVSADVVMHLLLLLLSFRRPW